MYYKTKFHTNKGSITQISVIKEHIEVSFLDLGANIYTLLTPDHNQKLENIVLEWVEMEDYFDNELFANAMIGPYAGRIKDATYALHGQVYQTDHYLHSGSYNIAYQIFDYDIVESTASTDVIFTLETKDNLAFPGNQTYIITYHVYEDAIELEYQVTTDQDTILNLTNHTYFNLSGNYKEDVLDHRLQIQASKTVETDQDMVSIQEIPISKELDFRQEKILDDAIEALEDTIYQGIDHSFALDQVDYNLAQATYFDPISKREMKVYTTYPILHIYSHNYPHQKEVVGQNQRLNMGLCFETQYISNEINLKGEDTILKKGHVYHHLTKFVFGVRSE